MGDAKEDVVDLILDELLRLNEMQVGMILPGADEVIIDGDGFGESLLHAGRVVAEGVAVGGALRAGAEVEDRLVAVHQLVLGMTGLAEQLLPVLGGHVGGNVHRAAVIDDERGLACGLGNLVERVLHLQQEAQHALVDLEVEVAVLREEVGARLDEERGCLRQGEDGVSHFGEELLDTLVGGGFAGARSAGEDDFGDHNGNLEKRGKNTK